MAIRDALLERFDGVREAKYEMQNGQHMPVSLTLVDAGYRTEAVYSAVHQVGAGFMPVMGFGRSMGCVQADFSATTERQDKRPGDGWFQSRKGVARLCRCRSVEDMDSRSLDDVARQADGAAGVRTAVRLA